MLRVIIGAKRPSIQYIAQLKTIQALKQEGHECEIYSSSNWLVNELGIKSINDFKCCFGDKILFFSDDVTKISRKYFIFSLGFSSISPGKRTLPKRVWMYAKRILKHWRSMIYFPQVVYIESSLLKSDCAALESQIALQMKALKIAEGMVFLSDLSYESDFSELQEMSAQTLVHLYSAISNVPLFRDKVLPMVAEGRLIYHGFPYHKIKFEKLSAISIETKLQVLKLTF